MHSAADALEKLSYGIFDDPFADVSWPLPQHNALFAKCPRLFQNLFQPLLGISCFISFSLPPRALPSLGPAVGPGGIAPARLQARNLDAVSNSVSHDVIMLGHFVHTRCFCHFLPIVMPLARPRTSCAWWLTVQTGMRWSVTGGQGIIKSCTGLLQNFGAMEFRWALP